MTLTFWRAYITPTDAVSRLYHFCNTLTKDPYVDPSPTFIFENDSLNSEGKSISARIVLPSNVDLSVRESCSRYRWKSEKSARRDAAFQAYKALYSIGLINDHLLPVRAVDPEVEAALSKVEVRPNVVEAAEQIHLWHEVASVWRECKLIHASKVTVSSIDNATTEVLLLFPLPLPTIRPFLIHWDKKIEYQVDIESNVLICPPVNKDMAQRVTDLLLRSVFSGRMSAKPDDLTILFTPSQSIDEMQQWLDKYSGRVEAEDAFFGSSLDQIGLVRDMRHNGMSPF